MKRRPDLAQPIEVFKNEVFVGRLIRTPKGCRFEFDPSITAGGKSVRITYRIFADKNPYEIVGVNLPAYFAGLLPEGKRLTALVKSLKTSEDDLFGLLQGAGTEPVGDLHFSSQGTPGFKKGLEKLTSADFAEIKKEFLRTGQTLNYPVSGVQNKISGSRLTLPLNLGIKSRTKQYILKFDSAETPDLIENEFYSLQMAKACGFQVNKAEIINDSKGEKALLITRFDREWLKERNVFTRFHQEDACQFLDRYPADKYHLSMQEIAEGIVGLCETPQIEILALLKLAAFSYLIGNGDLHGKNISLIQKEISTLSPVYDIVCTYVYGDQQMALAMDGKKDNWKRSLLIKFGERYGVTKVSIEKMLDQLIAKFAKNKDLLWKAPILATKQKMLEDLFKIRLKHLS